MIACVHLRRQDARRRLRAGLPGIWPDAADKSMSIGVQARSPIGFPSAAFSFGKPTCYG